MDQSQKDKYYMISCVCEIQKPKQTTEQKQTHKYRELVFARLAGKRMTERGERGLRDKTSSYKINNLQTRSTTLGI